MLLKCGNVLAQTGMFAVANDACYAPAGVTADVTAAGNKDGYAIVDAAHDHCRAEAGHALCMLRLVQQRDPGLQLMDTVQTLLAALQV